MIYIGFFVFYPFAREIALSFTNAQLIAPSAGSSVGFSNYSHELQSGAFYGSLRITFEYVIGTVVVSTILGLSAALLVNESFRGRSIVRAILVYPWALPGVAMALTFSWIYNDNDGVANRFLGFIGISPQGWLTDPNRALMSVTIATIWKSIPFVMMVYLASLQTVPKELREAAHIDGAGSSVVFRAVVWPHLRPTTRVIVLLVTIWTLKNFEVTYLLTGGGPLNRTNSIAIDTYRTAFPDTQLGRAAAIGVIGVAISLAVTAVYFLIDKVAQRREAR